MVKLVQQNAPVVGVGVFLWAGDRSCHSVGDDSPPPTKLRHKHCQHHCANYSIGGPTYGRRETPDRTFHKESQPSLTRFLSVLAPRWGRAPLPGEGLSEV